MDDFRNTTDHSGLGNVPRGIQDSMHLARCWVFLALLLYIYTMTLESGRHWFLNSRQVIASADHPSHLSFLRVGRKPLLPITVLA